MRPLDFECTLSQGFGANANGFYQGIGLFGHPGVDESCGYGTPVHSYVQGEVYSIHSPANPKYDGYTAVYMLCETPLETFEFTVGHLSRIDVRVGDTVTRGQKIGEEGNKGVVYQGGQRITLDMQRRGDRRGSHRHTQKRPVYKTRTHSFQNTYLHDANGLVQRDGFYFQVAEPNNGYNGCVNFAAPVWNRDLYYVPGVGSRGYDVYLLQKAMNLQGHGDFEPTGYYGPLTLAAVSRFQTAVGITPAHGYFGRVTRRNLNAVYKQL